MSDSMDQKTVHLIGEDKGLSQEWLDSVVARGQPEIWSGKQLRFVGMPVGGIGCGQLYLAGDGRLWLWDIFKCNYSRESVSDGGMSMGLMTMCGHYIKPVDSATGRYHPNMGAQVEQGFAIHVKQNGKTQTRPLEQTGFDDITFRGEYPIGRVAYASKQCPVSISLEAYSPFIPLDAKSSALPATVLEFSINNASKSAVEVSLMGWLQNAVNPYDDDAALGHRRSIIESDGHRISLHHTVQPSADVPEDQGLQSKHGYGSMALSILNADRSALRGRAQVNLPLADLDFDKPAKLNEAATQPLYKPLVGAIGQTMRLSPGQSRTVTFLLTWYFPLYQEKGGEMSRIVGFDKLHRHYQPWFKDAAEVAKHVDKDRKKLLDGTRLWHRTWYDSTLPYWLLDRSMIPTDALASHTVHWFDNGRFWGWEGVECCPGTVTHVWNYVQAVARLFPEFEKDTRQRVDYDLAMKEDGGIAYRGEFTEKVATDGQGGVIMRTWREHTMSADDRFLRRVWPKVKRAIEYLVRMDGNDDGILEGPQAHTLDASWEGPMGWISSIYCGSLRAGAAMAEEMGDKPFADKCRQIADRGKQNMVKRLFNGEYFIHIPPDFKRINTNKGCHIDQVLGQSWASQYGLPRVLPPEETVSALNSLWKYNFTADAGGYAERHKAIKARRIYADRGEAGLMMTTWPYGGAEVAVPGMEKRNDGLMRWQGPGGYFDENMTGFEYQVAAHMVYEGRPGSELAQRGLAITRAIHDRYAPARRNPFNEIECGDHYARAMAVFGVYLGACGYQYHGPRGHLAFGPKIRPSRFKAAFTSAEGWGSYSQTTTGRQLQAQVDMQWGRLRLNTLSLAFGGKATNVKVVLGDQTLPAALKTESGQVLIEFENEMLVKAGQRLKVGLT